MYRSQRKRSPGLNAPFFHYIDHGGEAAFSLEAGNHPWFLVLIRPPGNGPFLGYVRKAGILFLPET